MKFTKKIYRRGRNQGRTRKTAIRPQKNKKDCVASKSELAGIRRGRAAIKRGDFVTLEKLMEDMEDVAEMRKRLKEPGPGIPWEEVKKELKC